MSRQTTLRESERAREGGGGRRREGGSARPEWGPQWAGEIMSREDRLKLSPRVPRWGTTLWPVLLHQTTRKLNEHIHLFLLPTLFLLTWAGGAAYRPTVNGRGSYSPRTVGGRGGGVVPNIFSSRTLPLDMHWTTNTTTPTPTPSWTVHFVLWGRLTLLVVDCKDDPIEMAARDPLVIMAAIYPEIGQAGLWPSLP